MAIAVLAPVIAPYRVPLYERLAREHGAEVLTYGGGERYVPPWFETPAASAAFPTRALADGWREALALAGRYDAVIAPYGGGAILPAAYLGCRARRRPFLLWASVWAQPLSVTNLIALPVTRDMYRHAAAVVAYGEHARRFVARRRGRDDDVFVAPQSVEADLFGRLVEEAEKDEFRARHGIPPGPVALYVGRLVTEKGIAELLGAWESARPEATLVVIGDGPLADQVSAATHTRLLGALPRDVLPVAYAVSDFLLVPSLATRRFREPWGLVCNEAMHQGRPVIATSAVGAAAGGLVRDGETGVVVAPRDGSALAAAIVRLLGDGELRRRLGAAGHRAVASFNYDAMAAAFDRAIDRK